MKEAMPENPAENETTPRPIPVAYLESDSGRRLVVSLGEAKGYALLLPPDYSLDGAQIGDWVLDAAIGKYGFTKFEEEQEPLKHIKHKIT